MHTLYAVARAVLHGKVWVRLPERYRGPMAGGYFIHLLSSCTEGRSQLEDPESRRPASLHQ